MKISDIHSEIQMGIIDHFSVYPDASASVLRMCNHWLANEKYSHDIAQVQTAVDGLLARGEIHKHSGANIYIL
ncbi:MAG: hypothetical protein MJK12_00905 [Colwellia sp.]|nr:hypothetical protein [Colwellia sp.]